MKKHDLEDSLNDSLNTFSESVDQLLKNPTIENARRAQLASLVAFSEIYSTVLLAGDLKQEIYNQFSIDSNDCLTGFTLLDNKNIEIAHYSKQVDFRKELAIELKLKRFDYVSQSVSSIYEEQKRGDNKTEANPRFSICT